MEMKLYYGEDEGDDEQIDANSPGAIVIESVSNIRTVASLNLEDERAMEYVEALKKEDPHPARTNMIKGTSCALLSSLGTERDETLTHLSLLFRRWSFGSWTVSANGKVARMFRPLLSRNSSCNALSTSFLSSSQT